MTDNEGLLRALDQGRVDFILIGGVAAIVHGSARLTLDLDVVYARGRDNVERLVSALAPFDPYPRGAPEGLPFQWDVRTVLAGLNFTLKTKLGGLDLLGEASGGGTYEMLLPRSTMLRAYGLSFRCVTLEALIFLKRAAGRPKDLETIAELEALTEEIRRQR